jgi:DNA-binding transcriptional ArsR family regulator
MINRNKSFMLSKKTPPPPSPAVETFSRDFKQAPLLTVTTLEQLKVISDPLRLQIMEAVVTEARTVKQVADLLGKPATKLYYHVSALEGAGFVTVVETRIKSGIIEKYYRTVAENIQVDKNLLRASELGDEALEQLLSTIFDGTAEEIRQSVKAKKLDWPGQKSPKRTALLGRSLMSVRDEDVPKLIEKLEAVLKEFDQHERPDKQANYGLTIAFYPRLIPGESVQPKGATHEPKSRAKRQR